MPDLTFVALMDTIIRIHCDPSDEECVFFWADIYDGLGPKAFPRFWQQLQERLPGGSVDDIVAAWSLGELKGLYRQVLWQDM